MVVVLKHKSRKRVIRNVHDELELLLGAISDLGEINDCPAARVGSLAALTRSTHRELIARGAIAAKRIGQPRLHAVLQRCLDA